MNQRQRMDDIIEPTMDYNFSQLYLGPPITLAGGNYFTKLLYGTNKKLFIQTPKCLTKQGFVKCGKKIYADLMFDNNDTVFIHWIESLEETCQNLIFEKKDVWFNSQLEKDDINSAFTSPLKIYKSGKYYLLRVNINPNMKIYDENNNIQSFNLEQDKHIIGIVEVQGMKFTSKNFQIEFELKQSMIVSPDPFLDECFIKQPLKKNIISTTSTNTLTNTSTSILDNSLKTNDNNTNTNTNTNTNINNKINQTNKNDTIENIDTIANDIMTDYITSSKEKNENIDIDKKVEEVEKENDTREEIETKHKNKNKQKSLNLFNNNNNNNNNDNNNENLIT